MNRSKTQSLTEFQQNYRVSYLAICFLTLFLSFSNLQNMFSTLCQQYKYTNLGQTAILIIYVGACCSTPLTSFIVKKIGFKISFFFCSIGYILFEASGLFMVLHISQNPFIVKGLIFIGAFFCGFSASILWVAQGGYVSQISNKQNKSKLFALFWSIIVSNQIIGNLMSTFILGKINTQIYFIVLTCLGVLSSILFIFLPYVQVKQQLQLLNLNSQMQKIKNIISNKKYKYLIIYFFFPGLSMAFYSGYLYKIVKSTIPQLNEQPQDHYHQKINSHQCMIFIALGISQVLTGVIYRKNSNKFNKFKLATLGSLMVQFAGIVSFICYLQNSYYLCFIAAFLWGSCEIFMQTNTAVIVSILFQQRIQGFAVSRIFYCIGITLFLLLNILRSEGRIIVFLSLFIIIQTFATVISINLKYLSSFQGNNKFLQNQDQK